jgi:hypothetical protein
VNIELDPKGQSDLEALARESRKDPGTLLRELVHEAIADRKQNGAHSSVDEAATVASQSRALEELIQELDAIPSEGLPAPKERPVSENVDQYLYGWKK